MSSCGSRGRGRSNGSSSRQGINEGETAHRDDGWSYDFWLGNFYPESLASQEYLSEYARRFNSVEVDSTFNRIPNPRVVGNWRERTPKDFVFCAKFPGSITHEKVLRGSEGEVKAFIKNISLLGGKLGPLLLQFPYSFKPESHGLLKDFLFNLPEGFRYAVEVKNRKWLEERFYAMLRDVGVALALLDHPWMPEMNTLTADFTYIRWVGDRRKIRGTTGAVERYRNDDIRDWGFRIENFLEDSVEVFGFFSKFYSGHSPTDAEQLLKALK
jgi:uncharacterized protein YecE (DUF72 family)